MVDPKKKRPGTTDPPPSPSERWESETDLAKTVRMPSSGPTMRPGVPRPSPRTVELFVVDESQLPGGERKAWRAAEIWTKRRIYGLDSTFKCIEILDRASGRPEPGHELLGARLGGGRQREKEMVKFSYPLPLPGMEAMFTKNKKHGYTSVVERMIVRIRVLHTSPDDQLPSWEEIASRWSEAPPKMK
ncbi:MAG TPA: hypothetical protein VIF62_10005 [Labilithrix sp.]|jgi:hypothetical protein